MHATQHLALIKTGFAKVAADRIDPQATQRLVRIGTTLRLVGAIRDEAFTHVSLSYSIVMSFKAGSTPDIHDIS